MIWTTRTDISSQYHPFQDLNTGGFSFVSILSNLNRRRKAVAKANDNSPISLRLLCAPAYRQAGLRLCGENYLCYLASDFPLTLSGLLFLPSEIRLAKRRYAPGTPSGNSRKNESPV